MTHLTNREVLEAADRMLTTGGFPPEMVHVNECASCRREIELQVAVLRSARVALSPGASEAIRRSVLRTLQTDRKHRRYRWLAGNLGNIMALAGVIAMAVGLATAFTTYVSPRIAGGAGNTEGMVATAIRQITSFLPKNPLGFLEAIRVSHWSGAISVIVALGLLFLLDALFRRIAGRGGTLA